MYTRYLITGVVSLVAGIFFLLFGGVPFWWFGAGFVAAGIGLSVWSAPGEIGEWIEWLRQPREIAGYEVVPSSVLAEVACLFIIALLTSFMMPQVTLGDRPVGHDHPVHFFKAWQLKQEFLADGHLFGWSHRWFAGYPAQYLYPIGADLLVVVIDVVTLGFADLETSYAWAIWLVWFVTGYSVYRFGTQSFGRWAGLLAAVLFMTDTADNRIGGWLFAVEWGVWPMSLAVVLGVWAISRVPRLMEGEKWRDFAIFGVLMAASLISHPFAIIHFGIALVVALFVYWLADTEHHWLVGSARLGVGVVVGALIASIWVLPFLAYQAEIDPSFGGTWATMLELGRSFYQLDFLSGTWSMATAFGIGGMFALMWSRKFDHLLIGSLSVVFIVVGSSDFVAGFNLIDHLGAFERIHFMRFVALMKPYFLLATAYAVVAIVRYTSRRGLDFLSSNVDDVRDEDGMAAQPAARRWFHLLFIFVCLAPLAVPFAELYETKHIERNLTNASERPHQTARDRAAQWFNDEYPSGEPFFRVATGLRRHDHHFVDWGRRIPFPVYKLGYTPATAFEYRLDADSEKALKALNVRYVLTPNRPPHRGKFEKIEDFGSLRLYEYQEWQKEPFEVIEGDGPVELESWGNEVIELQAGKGAHGRLRLNVSHCKNWTAYRNGEPIAIEETELDIEGANGFPTVELEPGTYRFVFERGWAEFSAYVLFLIGMSVAVIFVLADTRISLGRRLREKLESVRTGFERHVVRKRRLLGTVGVALAVVCLLALFWMASVWTPLDTRSSKLGASVTDVRYDFGDRLRDATVRVQEGPSSTRVCEQMFGYYLCGRSAWQAVHQRVDDFGIDLLVERCIWAHPLPAGPLEIAFSNVPRGDALIGFYGVPEYGAASRAGPVQFKVGVDGDYRYSGKSVEPKELSTFRVPLENRRERGSVDVLFRIAAEQTGKRYFCFNAQVVDVQGTLEADGGDGAARR